ncbi:MAG: PqqD family protein [Xanthobacteraceae bacterium]|nr:PqqD family protein [Xanthobacteraceae bacterium]
MPIEPCSKFALTTDCEVNVMSDGIVIYQASKEKVHYLNPTAAIVYRLCGEKASVEQTIEYLQKAFSLPEPPQIEVRQCIDQFLSEGLIVPC